MNIEKNKDKHRSLKGGIKKNIVTLFNTILILKIHAVLTRFYVSFIYAFIIIRV